MTLRLHPQPKQAFLALFILLFSITSTHAQQQLITTVAGGSIGDGKAAVSIGIFEATGVVTDSADNLWFLDVSNNRIRKVDAATGIISTIAGGGTDYVREGTAALSARLTLSSPLSAIAMDSHHNIYFTQFPQIIKLDAATGLLHIVAYKIGSTAGGDGGPAIDATMVVPTSLATDRQNNLYLTDGSSIRKISTTGIITTIAGNAAQKGYAGDGAPAVNALLSSPGSVTVDDAGNVYVIDAANNRVRKVTASTGIINTVTGTGAPGDTGDGGPATAAQISYTYALTADGPGNLYLTDNNRVRKITAATGIISSLTSVLNTYGYPVNGGPAIYTSLLNPREISVSPAGNIYLIDNAGVSIRKISAADGTINAYCGNNKEGTSGIPGPIADAQLLSPQNIAVDRKGNIYLSDSYNNQVYKLDAATHTIYVVIGTGKGGFNEGNGGPAISAILRNPRGITTDSTGNIYLTDNGYVRKVTIATGIITRVAGQEYTTGYTGDGGLATSATLNQADGVAVDRYGNIYIADKGNNCIRKVTASTGIISTLAGTGVSGYTGDGGPATSATLNQPFDVTVDKDGNVYVTDNGNNVIRKITASTGIISTVAGTGIKGYSGDNSLATTAKLFYPYRVITDSTGNLYISDQANQRVRKVDISTGVITTLVGTGAVAYNGDNIAANTANLNNPIGLSFDTAGNLYIGDIVNNRIRKVTNATAVPFHALLTGTAFYDDNGNGARDAGEQWADDIHISIKSANAKMQAITKNGIFKLQSDTGAIAVSIDSLAYYTVSPTSATIQLSPQHLQDSLSFALKPTAGKQDLQVTLLSTGAVRSGMPTSYRIYYKNAGTVAIDNVQLSFVNTNKAFVTGATPAYDGLSADSSTITWQLHTLDPHAAGTIDVNTTLFPSPVANISDYLHPYAFIHPVAGDLTPLDDTSRLTQLVRGSFDPNELSETHGQSITPAQVAAGEYLYYTIRFQNTGNDTAFTVTVRDTLDTRLDMTSFAITGSSHPLQLSIQDNKLTWTFNNILLPDSTVNEKASHGFISFRIRPKSTLQTGDVIAGTGAIYFDFNLPVLTNTIHTTVRALPALPPAPATSPIAAGYCGNAAAQPISIANLPATPTSAWVRIGDSVLSIGPDSIFNLQPSQLHTGENTLQIAYNNEAGESSAAYTFNVVTPSDPAVSIAANKTTVTDATDQVMVTATNRGGGGDHPLYTFSKDRTFSSTLQAESAANTASVAATDLANGENWIYVRMKTSDTCYTHASVSDSIRITRQTATGIIDPDAPSTIINNYPNPFTTSIIFTGLLPAKTYQLDVYNTLGQLVTVKMISGLSSDVLYTSGWAHGSYWIKITDVRRHRQLGVLHVNKL